MAQTFSSWSPEMIDKSSFHPLDEQASKKDEILNFSVSQAILLAGKIAWLKYLWLCSRYFTVSCLASYFLHAFFHFHKAHLLFVKIVICFYSWIKSVVFGLPHLFSQRDHWFQKFATISYVFNAYFFDTPPKNNWYQRLLAIHTIDSFHRKRLK